MHGTAINFLFMKSYILTVLLIYMVNLHGISAIKCKTDQLVCLMRWWDDSQMHGTAINVLVMKKILTSFFVWLF